MMKFLFITLFGLFGYAALHAQEKECLSQPYPFENQSDLIRQREEVPVLTVVFHILYADESENLSDQRIAQQIEILNNDFSLSHEQTADIPGYALFNAANCGIRFKLAETDPTGVPTDGIIRKSVLSSNIGDLFDINGRMIIKQSESGGSDAWDPSRYINIWVGKRTTSLGFTVGLDEVPDAAEGIVINPELIGRGGLPPYDLGRTLTHEMGHYLGLLHPWGMVTGCDNEDDLVSDTPFQSNPNFDCKSERACNIQPKSGNFMDFHPDVCMLYFTKGQCARMQNILLSLRPSLLESTTGFDPIYPQETEKIKISGTPFGIEIYNNTGDPIQNITLLNIAGHKIATFQMEGENYLNIPSEGIPQGLYLFLVQKQQSAAVIKFFIHR